MGILQLPGVQEVAVVDTSKETTEELLLTAFVVQTGSLSEEQIAEPIRQGFANHKQLKGGVVFTESLPRNEVC